MNKQIVCKPLDVNYLKIAVEMAQENYDLEKESVTALSNTNNRVYYHSRIEELFQHGIGRIAFQNNDPVGFLAFHPIFDTGNGIMGATSPLYGYGIRNENRGKVIGLLFQSTAAELCEKYAQSLRINVYAHDTDVLHMYIMSAFAMDTTDVVRNTSVKIPAVNITEKIFKEKFSKENTLKDNTFKVNTPTEYRKDITFAELNKTQILDYRADVIELYRDLINHLHVSPVFYHCKGFLPIEDRFEDFLSDDMRIFAAFHKNQFIGMIDSEPTNIDFARNDSKAMGMGDVFIKPDYRGLGLGVALLAYANDRIRESGIDRIYVTHGTINPTARGFWDKYFTNYAYTMTRRINPEMLGIIKRI